MTRTLREAGSSVPAGKYPTVFGRLKHFGVFPVCLLSCSFYNDGAPSGSLIPVLGNRRQRRFCMQRPWRLILALLCALAPACNDSSKSSPTSPAFINNLSGAVFWKGTLTFEDASPRGNCLVEGFLANPTSKQVVMRAESSILERSSFWVRIFTSGGGGDYDEYDEYSVDPYQGFYPGDYYEGSLDASGALLLVFGRPTPQSIWLPAETYCVTGWARLGGTLAGTISSDGTRFQGDIIETFRVIASGAEFAIRSRIDLEQKSFEESF
jgi:hypothetical protein